MAKPIKETIDIDFSQGLDLKTDEKHVRPGKFLALSNSVFDTVGRLTKRNGFPSLTTLPNTSSSFLTTFNDDLQAIGANVLAYSAGQQQWLNKGSTYPLQLSTLPLVRNSINQVQADCAVAPNGVICTVFTNHDGTTAYRYVVADSVTGQNIIAPTDIPTSVGGTVSTSPRVFLLGNYFVIVFGDSGGFGNHLQLIAISITTGLVALGPTDISTVLAPNSGNSTPNFDGGIATGSGRLYLAWSSGVLSGIRACYITPQLVVSPSVLVSPGVDAQNMSITVDNNDLAAPIIWATFYDSTQVYSCHWDKDLGSISTTLAFAASGVVNITALADNDLNTLFIEVPSPYGYDGSIANDTIVVQQIQEDGTVIPDPASARGIGLASKAFKYNGVIYYLAAYQSPYQPTYFLMDGTHSTQAAPLPIARLAYQNGGGYLHRGLPNVTMLSGNTWCIPYLFKDLVQAVNKNTNVPAGNQVAGIYSQTGVNLVKFVFDYTGLASVEAGQNLNLSGGFLWSYDGYVPTENNFFLWPDSVEATWSASGGSMSAKPDGSTNTDAYFYQVTYEWTDNQGNTFRSAPSIPVAVTTTGSGNTGSVVINVPTARLTYKIANPAKIVIYRWSVNQQSYYQVTSITQPLLNDTTTDAVAFTDTLADVTILGNNLLYTTGGVLEDVGAPASSIMTLFDTRLWLVDAENPNLLWFSKQVIPSTPVEMSDLLTLYVAPSIGAEGPTGVITALSPLDDKLIIFKANAIYYVNGTGPDSTGANNQYSQPTFITSTVGCTNPRSIVTMPGGLMFQSNKGIWLLGRDMSTKYIGAPVEAYNAVAVNSAQAVPATNQVRFGLANGAMLMYDYFVSQWGTFDGAASISSTLYQGAHTIVNQYGQVWRETVGSYLDGTNPVLMSLTTGWLRLAGLRGYQRAFWFTFLGTFLSPHKLQVQIGYDYNDSPVQSDLINPLGYNGPFGSDPTYGGDGSTPFGGPNTLENFRVFLQHQRCKAFQLTITEVFDPSFGTVAGAGLTLSGIQAVVGLKSRWAPINQEKSVG